MLISFIIPCYRSERTIKKVVQEAEEVIQKKTGYDYEIVLVNDYSPDNVYEILVDLASKNKKIKVVNLAKNMGKHAAMLAGFSVAEGEYYVNMDDDGQCPVDRVWELIECLEKDQCDVAMAKYHQKKQSGFKNFGSSVNHMMTCIMLDKPSEIVFTNFSVFKKFVAQEMVSYKAPYPYIEGLVFRITKRIKTIEMEERNRADELPSGYNLKKSLSLWINGLTAFSVKPLRVASIVGLFFSILGFGYGLYTILHKLVNPNVLLGYSSLLAVLLFSSGMMMMMLGMIGEYIGRIYICINAAPQYVIKDTINVEKREQWI